MQTVAESLSKGSKCTWHFWAQQSMTIKAFSYVTKEKDSSDSRFESWLYRVKRSAQIKITTNQKTISLTHGEIS